MNASEPSKPATTEEGDQPRAVSVVALPPAGRSFAIWGATLAIGVVGFYFFMEHRQPGPMWLSLAFAVIASYFEQRMLPGLKERTELRNARKEGQRLLKAVRSTMKKQSTWTGSGTKEKLEAAATSLEDTLHSNDTKAIEAATQKLDELADKSLSRKPAYREYAEQIGGALLAALLLRAFAYEAFKIPSSSMVPTLLVGDHLFVNKFVYGFRIPFTLEKINAKLPERGDIVVFNKPGDEGGDDIIKRVIGLPGDVIEVSNRHITVNGQPLDTKPQKQVHLNAAGDNESVTDKGPFWTFQPFEEVVGKHTHVMLEWVGHQQLPPTVGRWVVEPGHVFVMGDNRDNSQDSRFGREDGGFGQVPVNYIKGRADIIWLSLGGPNGIRFDRMFQLLR